MKTLHVVVLVVLLSVVGHAQTQSKPQSEPQAKPRGMANATHAIKGPVKTFRTEIATFVLKDGEYVEGPRVVQDEGWFNRDGNRTDYHIYVKGVLARRIAMKFEGRKMLECINYDGNGNAWLRIVNTYDDKGEIKEVNTYHGDGSLRSTRTYKRNSRGQVVQHTETSAQGVIMEQVNNKFEGTNLYSSERKLYYPNGSLQSESLTVMPDKQTETQYNRDGSVSLKRVRIGQEMAHYGPDGSLQKATVIAPEDRLLDEMILQKDGPATRKTQLPDETDQHGNWTRQTKWLADANGTRALTVTYRTLTYYEN